MTATALPKEKLKGNVRVDFNDFQIVGYAKYLIEQNIENDVYLATDNLSLKAFALTNNIKTFDSSELLSYFGAQTGRNKTISKNAQKIESKQKLSVFLNLIIALAILIGFVFLIRNYSYIVDKYSNFLSVIFLVAIGFGLFEIRLKWRQLYGFVEIGFGILSIVICFFPNIILSNWDFYLKIMAGLYIIVRGLDNLYQGSEKNSLGSLLKKIFRLP